MKRLVLFSTLLGGLSQLVTAQTTSDVYWGFSTAAQTSTTPTNPDLSTSSLSQGNNNGTTSIIQTSSSSSGYTFTLAGASTPASGGNNAGAAAVTGAFSASTSTYFEATFTPGPGLYLGISAVNFASRSTGTGPQGYTISTNVAGFNTPVASGTLSNNSTYFYIANSVSVAGGLGAPITLRVYGNSGTGTPGANTANWRIDDLVVTVTTSSVPLSLTNIGFNASTKAGKVFLNWNSSDEVSLSTLSIERSTDARNFLQIGVVSVQGGERSFIDEMPATGLNHYRLRLTDKSGRESFSAVRTVSFVGKSNSSISIFPNPASQVVSVKGANNVSATLFDMTGRSVRTTAGQNGQAAMNLDGLPAGLYILEAQDGNTSVRERLQVVR